MQEVHEAKPLGEIFAAWFAWFRLLRLPHLLTAPGDALAGVAWLALVDQTHPEPRHLYLLAGAVTCLCAFGFILNDLHDYDTDGMRHPERPLASGQIPVALAALGLVAFLAGGLLLALRVDFQAFLYAVLLACLIGAYNLLLKDIGLWGRLNLGLCRAVGFLLLVPLPRWLGFPGLLPAGLLCYTAAVALLQQRQEGTWRHRWCAWVPAVFMSVNACALLGWSAPRVPPPQVAAMALLLLAAVAATLRTGWRLAGAETTPRETRAGVASLTFALLPFQAACLCLHRGTWPLAAALVVLWPLAAGLGHWFLASDLRHRAQILAQAQQATTPY
jgi:hypothetical protein